jgi:hypothetical protein
MINQPQLKLGQFKLTLNVSFENYLRCKCLNQDLDISQWLIEFVKASLFKWGISNAR